MDQDTGGPKEKSSPSETIDPRVEGEQQFVATLIANDKDGFEDLRTEPDDVDENRVPYDEYEPNAAQLRVMARRHLTIGDDERKTRDANKAIRRLTDPNTYFARAFDCYCAAMVNLAKAASKKPAPENHQLVSTLWLNCTRLFNTAMYLYHGRGEVATELCMEEWRDRLGHSISAILSSRYDHPDDVFEGIWFGFLDGSVDPDDMLYRFHVADPNVGFWTMRLSNLQLRPDPIARHDRGPPAPEHEGFAARARESHPGGLVGVDWRIWTKCPWETLGKVHCSRECQAVRR